VSLDCNENGVPDSCDIASGFAQDRNGNGIPDPCDIATGHRSDQDHNGIPDECSIGNMPTINGGDGVDDNGCAPAPEDLDAEWVALYDWWAAQGWGPDCEQSGAEQFQRYVDKLCELGLIGLTE